MTGNRLTYLLPGGEAMKYNNNFLGWRQPDGTFSKDQPPKAVESLKKGFTQILNPKKGVTT